jgi:PAS domain S-box-containing protein
VTPGGRMGLAVDELQTRTERLQAIADNLPALIAYWDRDERCQFSNRACMVWFGVDPDSQIGKPMREVLGESLYTLSKSYIDGVLRGEPQFFERSLVDAAGVLRATQTSYIPDVKAGSVQGFFVLISEISAIKRAEAAAMESRAQLQALLGAVPDYILSLDREGRILFANRTMARPIQSLLGNAVQEYFPDEHKQLAQRAIELAFEAGLPSTLETVATLGEDKRWFTCQFIPVLRDGKPRARCC